MARSPASPQASAAAMTSAELDERIEDVRFAVFTNFRYHMRRRDFFESMHAWFEVLTIFASSGAIAAVVRTAASDDPFKVLFLGAIAFVQTLSMVMKPSQRAKTHQDLARQYIGIQHEIELAANPTEAELRKWNARLLELYGSEPPMLRVLQVQCENEYVDFKGLPAEQKVPVGGFQRWLSPFMDVGAHKLARRAPEAPRLPA